MKPVEVGDVAPDFTAETQTGQPVTLSDFRGRQAVVLYFYPKDGTSVCTREACAFRDAYEDFVRAGAAVIGASGDSLERHRQFVADKRLPFLLISDADGSLRKLYGVPKTFGIFPGRVTYVIGPDGVVRNIFNSQFSADRHVTEALEVVRQLAPSKGP